jgi:hypothetical protein
MASERTATRRGAIARTSAKTWIAKNRDIAWDAVRVYLGFAPVIKGFAYVFHHGDLATTMAHAGVPLAGLGLAEAVAVVHIAGLHPDFPHREEDDLPDCWAPFEGRVTVGWE